MSRILRLKPASQPQNLRAETEKLERVTYRCSQQHATAVYAVNLNSTIDECQVPFSELGHAHERH